MFSEIFKNSTSFIFTYTGNLYPRIEQFCLKSFQSHLVKLSFVLDYSRVVQNRHRNAIFECECFPYVIVLLCHFARSAVSCYLLFGGAKIYQFSDSGCGNYRKASTGRTVFGEREHRKWKMMKGIELFDNISSSDSIRQIVFCADFQFCVRWFRDGLYRLCHVYI